MPYSPEYLRFHSDPILLKQIAERTGGRVLKSGDLDLYHPQRTPRESTRPVIDWFLILLACLVPLDVAVRRVQLDWALLRDTLLRRKQESSGETMGALLQRKEKVQAALTTPREDRPRTPFGPPPKPEPPPTSDQRSEPPSQSTTERLLARKRKRQDDQN